MSIVGKCKMLRIFVDEGKQYEGKLVYQTIINKLLSLKLAGATVFRGIEGFGSSWHMHMPSLFTPGKMPMLIEVVDTPAQIHKALNEIEPMLPTHCLVTVQDIQVLHYHHPDGKHTQTKRLD